MKGYDRRQFLKTAGVGVGSVAAGNAAAQGEPSPSTDLFTIEWLPLPEPTAGETAEFEVTIEIFEEPDLLSDVGAEVLDLHLELTVDGTVADATELAVEWDESYVETLEHEFGESGEFEVTVEGELDGSLIEPDTDVVDGTVEVLPEPIAVSGASFEIPSFFESSVQDLLDDIEDSVPLDIANPLLVADQSQLVLAVIEEEPRDALVDIEGLGLDVEFDPPGFELELGVVVGTESVTFDESATPVSLQELSENPDEYAFERVEVPGDHVAAAVRTRFDIGDTGVAVNFPTQTGALVDDAPELDDVFPSPGTDLFHIVNEPSPGNMGRVLPDHAADTGPFVFTGEFDTAFWESAPKDLTGVVVPPETPVADFLGTEFFPEPDHEMRDEIHGVVHAEESPLLYVHEERYETRDDIDSVADITAAGGELDGDLVAFDVPVGQTTISVKETLEAAIPCGDADDWIELPEGCAPIFHDVLLHGGAAWDPAPEDTDDFVGLVGVSAKDQEVIAKQRAGLYSIVAEVVDTSRLDEDLPGEVALVVYDMEFLEPLDIVGIVEDLIEELVDTLEESIAIDDDQNHLPLGPQPLPPFEDPPQDLNDDGRYEDIDGDGEFDIFDVQALFDNIDSEPVQNNPAAFDFNEDGADEVTIFDVQGLFARLQGWEETDHE